MNRESPPQSAKPQTRLRRNFNLFAKCEIFALCVKVRFTVREKMSSISANVRFYGVRKNVFHFRERSFLRCEKKCLPFP